MATGAADMMLRCVFNGSLSASDTDIERRPYHRNSKCALHKVKAKCSHAGPQQGNVSFPEGEFRNNCSFYISASTISSQPTFLHIVHGPSTRSRESSEGVFANSTHCLEALL
ncbi:hypothetical protein ACS0TY_021190 [Phlomoides rotata]